MYLRKIVFQDGMLQVLVCRIQVRKSSAGLAVYIDKLVGRSSGNTSIISIRKLKLPQDNALPLIKRHGSGNSLRITRLRKLLEESSAQTVSHRYLALG